MKVKDILNVLLKNSYYEKELTNRELTDERWFALQREYEQWLESEVNNDL